MSFGGRLLYQKIEAIPADRLNNLKQRIEKCAALKLLSFCFHYDITGEFPSFYQQEYVLLLIAFP